MKIYIIYFTMFLIPCILAAAPQGAEKTAGEYTSAGMTALSNGDYAEAIDNFKQAALMRPENTAVVYNIACCYSLLGNTDSAIVWLTKAFDLGVYVFADDSDLESLFDDPRFKELKKNADAKIAELQSREWLPVVVVPDGYDKDRVYPVVIGLHGFGSNPVDFSSSIDSALTESGYILCCPYGPEIRGSTAFGWGEYELSEKRIMEALEYLNGHYRIDKDNPVLLGYSQGANRALYMSLKKPEQFRKIITVAGRFSEDAAGFLKEGASYDVRMYLMIGEDDQGLESNKNAEQGLKKYGIKVKLTSYPGLGHAFPPNSAHEIERALQWLAGDQ